MDSSKGNTEIVGLGLPADFSGKYFLKKNINLLSFLGRLGRTPGTFYPKMNR